MTLADIIARTQDRKAAGIAIGQGQATPPTTVVVSLPCVHLGEPLTGAEREAAGLGHARLWQHCHHPKQPLGPAVCGCKGCGKRCPGYTPELPREEEALAIVKPLL